MIDMIVLAVAGLFGIFGMMSGAMKQLAKMLAMLGGYILSKPLGALLAPALASGLGIPLAAAKAAATGVLCWLLYLFLNFAVYWYMRSKVDEDAEKTLLNRLGGFALGGAKGLALVCIPISALLFFEKPLTNALGADPKFLKGSVVVTYLRVHNPLAALPIPQLAKLQQLAEAARNPQAAAGLAGDAKIANILSDPSLKAALGEDSLLQALQSGDWEAVQKDPRVQSLMQDPRIASQLQGMMDDSQYTPPEERQPPPPAEASPQNDP